METKRVGDMGATDWMVECGWGDRSYKALDDLGFLKDVYMRMALDTSFRIHGTLDPTCRTYR